MRQRCRAPEAGRFDARSFPHCRILVHFCLNDMFPTNLGSAVSGFFAPWAFGLLLVFGSPVIALCACSPGAWAAKFRICQAPKQLHSKPSWLGLASALPCSFTGALLDYALQCYLGWATSSS